MSSLSESVRPDRVTGVTLAQVASLLGVVADDEWADTVVTGVTSSSNDIRRGDIFFALPGAKNHGSQFAHDAIERGALAVVTDAQGATSIAGVPVLVIADPRAHVGAVAAAVYGTDHTCPKLFGITGTNGKTTAVYLLAGLLTQLGRTTGMSSTSERVIAGESYSSSLTTPEAPEMHALVARMSEAGVTDAVLEISAHALTRHRVDGFLFDVVGFTNFAQDHLDDYGSMEDYFQAKLDLFTPHRAQRAVVVLDSPWTQRVVDESTIPTVTVGSAGSYSPDWTVTVTARTARRTHFTLHDSRGTVLESSVPLVGDYSAINAALVIVMCVEAGISLASIHDTLHRDRGLLVSIPGRTEIVSGERGPTFYVDYGHTPQAFEVTLRALRDVTPGRLIMVFGADGDRDTTKREDMGANAARGADVVIVTDFHPRTEDPSAIRAQLLLGARGAQTHADIHEIPDPRDAVRLAISLAREGDTILYAGPGHEDYRDIGTARIEYSARDDARAALAEAGW